MVEVLQIQKNTNGALIAFSFDTPEEAKNFAKIAEENGGQSFQVDMGIQRT